MKKKGLIGKLKDMFDDLTGRNRFDRLDFVLLKTTLMLAAVDGEVAAPPRKTAEQLLSFVE